jgi:hypothetical protein
MVKVTSTCPCYCTKSFPSDDANPTEPPRKKRRSKWGIKPEDVGAESTAIPQGPKGAEAAAAKINAMLAAQGKLAKSEPPQYKTKVGSFAV